MELKLDYLSIFISVLECSYSSNELQFRKTSKLELTCDLLMLNPRGNRWHIRLFWMQLRWACVALSLTTITLFLHHNHIPTIVAPFSNIMNTDPADYPRLTIDGPVSAKLIKAKDVGDAARLLYECHSSSPLALNLTNIINANAELSDLREQERAL